MNDDTISRKATIDAVHTATYRFICGAEDGDEMTDADILVLSINKAVVNAIKALPSVQPTLYGYNIELLSYIARVMEKEGVTAEYAVSTFDDMSRAVRMIIEEAQQKTEEMLNEQFNQQKSGD